MPSSDVQTRPYATLIAGMIITGTLGSIHAFCVFVPAIESELAVSRSTVSSLYSFALLCLTLSVLLGHHVYSRAAPYVIAAASCSVAALGLGIAAQSSHMTGLYLGYSVMFGAANGVGYGFSLQLVAQAMPARRGFAMGIVTATYAVGATLFSKVLDSRIRSIDFSWAMAEMAIVLLAAAVLVAVLLKWSGATYRGPSNESRIEIDRRR